MSKSTCYVCVYVVICFVSVLCQLEEGSVCYNPKDGLMGKCAHIRRCLSSVQELKNREYPQICSFAGRDPIVCCTDCELVDDTRDVLVDKYGSHFFKTGRKASDKCLEHRVKLEYSCGLRLGLQKQKTEKCFSYESPFVAAAVGGQDAQKGEYPHMALLGYGDDLATAQWLCGGSVISDRFILTAAHCIGTSALGPVKFAALGILKRTDPPEQWQRYSISKIIPHPQYKAPSKYHDIALLQTDTKIKFSRLVLPACVDSHDGYSESYAKATGWGALGHRQQLADTLQVVDLEQYSTEECAEAFPPHRHLVNGYDQKTQTCYGDRKKITDTCEGDSGGPLQVSSKFGSCIYNIIGVTSYGKSCGVQGNSGVYTRVQHYVPWIESVVWP